MQNYKNLIVWQKSHTLTLEVYEATASFPTHELYGLTSQLRRSSSSIPTNLAEGTGKLTDLDFRRFVSTSFGSANEVEYLLFLSYCLKYLSEEDYYRLDAQSKEVKKMLTGLIESVTKGIYKKTFCIAIVLIGASLLMMI